jgi:hypothetical protein
LGNISTADNCKKILDKESMGLKKFKEKGEEQK